jgi:hypothetical protein
MFSKFFEVNGDSLVYGELAKNLLRYGRYAQTQASGNPHPTLIRLPGYPLFLAGCFHVFGVENYAAAPYLQIVMDLAGCLLLAGFVRFIAPPHLRTGASHFTLWLAALCPFTAIFATEPLTEAPTLYCLALAMWSAARFRQAPGWLSAVWFTVAVTCAAFLRPDGVLAAVAFVPVLFMGHAKETKPRSKARIAIVCILLAATPFTIWTWRNWQVFHVFEPLAPRSAADPGEDTQPGFERWTKTWCLDFVSTYQIYWNVPQGPLDVGTLPSRAFDSPEQYAETTAIAEMYNYNGHVLTPALDARFAGLARQRIAAHPLRYYLWLPVGRVADMWLRPRIENLPIDLDWWAYAQHNDETLLSWSFAVLNALYLGLAIAGLCLRPRLWWALLTYMLLRSAMLLTIAAPEARYTIECFPMLFALSGIALARLFHRTA